MGERLMKIGDNALALGSGSDVPLRLYPPKPVEVMPRFISLTANFVEHSSRKLIHFNFEAEDMAWRITSSL